MWGATNLNNVLLMIRNQNILTGCLAVVLGSALILWITPAQTIPAIFATVPSGFYPNFTSGMLIVSGLALAVSNIFAKQDKYIEGKVSGQISIRFSLSFILLVSAMAAAPVIGFVPTGICICVVTLLLMHEDRWTRIILISVTSPLLVWCAFEILLGRPLP